MRYSTSVLAAIVVSFFIFLGMSILVQTKHTPLSNEFEISNFNMISELEAPVKNVIVKPVIPEQEQVKQPPANPSIELTNNPGLRPTIISPGQGTIENMVLTGLDFPAFPNVPTGERVFGNSSELVQVAGIQPIYPQDAAQAGIEGWVKVEIRVNEFGLVSEVKILDANPKRIFDQATKRAMLKSKYKPMIIDGKAVAQSAVQVIEFKMNNN